MVERENVWPLGGYAPGNYICLCKDCKQDFDGDKRAHQCLECAVTSSRAALRAGGEPAAYMHPIGAIWRADNYPAGMDFSKDGWIPLYAHPAELDEARAELALVEEDRDRIRWERGLYCSSLQRAEAERDALAADKARLVELGWAFANQVRAVTYLLNGQAYSSTLSELNAFTAALGTSDKLAEAREGE